jgi:hypothetical protein
MIGYETPSLFPALSASFLVSRELYRTTAGMENLDGMANWQLAANASLVGLYAFSNRIYRPHPLPPSRHPSWPKLRASPIFSFLNIFLSMDRKINYPPNTPLRPLPLPSKADSIRKSILRITALGLMVDICTLPIFLFKAQLYLNGKRDFAHLCEVIGGKGLGEVVVRFWWMVCFGVVMICGLEAGWEMGRIVGVGSGIWVEEEWPCLMNKPWGASSMSDFWGKRYHQLLRASRVTIKFKDQVR